MTIKVHFLFLLPFQGFSFSFNCVILGSLRIHISCMVWEYWNWISKISAQEELNWAVIYSSRARYGSLFLSSSPFMHALSWLLFPLLCLLEGILGQVAKSILLRSCWMICQNLELASSLEKILHLLIWERVCSTESRMCLSQQTLILGWHRFIHFNLA